MVFSMYKPIAQDDSKTICALMQLYKVYYRVIGLIILVAGIAICPFITKLINGELPKGINVYILYIFNLLSTVFSYWLFAYKNSLLQAHQRNDITSKITISINTIQYILQFFVIYFFKNYYLYVIIVLLSQILINITTAVVVNKMYPNYKAEGKLEKDSIKRVNQRVKDLFTSKIGMVIVNSADTIVISAFLGLTELAIYQNYYYILTALIGVVQVIFTSCTAGIGNSIIVETTQKNYNDLQKFTFIIFWVAGFCMCELVCLYQQFMEFWVGKELMLGFGAVICFCIYYFIYEMNSLLNLYKDAAGIWHKDRYRPLITALVNLVMNLILVNFIGIYGVLLSTVLSTLIVGFPWLINNLFSEIFKISPRNYVIKLFKYFFTIIIVASISFILTVWIKKTTLSIIILKGIICGLITNIIIFIIYRNSKEMSETLDLLKKVLKRG